MIANNSVSVLQVGTARPGALATIGGQDCWTAPTRQVLNEAEYGQVEKQLQALGVSSGECSEEARLGLMSRVSADIQVLEAARGTGMAPARSVFFRHWAVFPTDLQAQAFAAWLGGRGYPCEFKRIPTAESDVQVQFAHKGRLTQYSICKRTVAFHQKAVSLGDVYDGWEVRFDGLRVGGSRRAFTERV